jgi:hypothetical protein
VVRVVWKTTDEMHERNYRKYYRMNFESFNNLGQLLTLFLRFENEIVVRLQTKIRLIIAAVVYRFAYGYNRLLANISSILSIREANCCVNKKISSLKPKGLSCATSPGRDLAIIRLKNALTGLGGLNPCMWQNMGMTYG